MTSEQLRIPSQEEAKKSKGEFSSRKALNVFQKAVKALQKSGGQPVELEVTGGQTSLKDLITKDDVSTMKESFAKKGWKLIMSFYEGEEDPGHYAPGWENFLILKIRPKKASKK